MDCAGMLTPPVASCDHIGTVCHPRNPDGPPYCRRCFESATDSVWAALRLARDKSPQVRMTWGDSEDTA